VSARKVPNLYYQVMQSSDWLTTYSVKVHRPKIGLTFVALEGWQLANVIEKFQCYLTAFRTATIGSDERMSHTVRKEQRGAASSIPHVRPALWNVKVEAK
jgi:hypothetical protein